MNNWTFRKESQIDKEIDSFLEKTKNDEIQGESAPNIFFRYNSVNVIIGQRGSGKTHYVLREVFKLLQHPESGYSTFLYSSSKIASDDTVEKFKPLFEDTPLVIQIINHEETSGIIDVLAEAKKTFNELKKLGPEAMDSPKYLDTLQKLNIMDLNGNTPHTIIFMDDCIDLLTKRGSLFKNLFENRQPKITYFLGLQDVHGIPPSMKCNVDSLVLFGGFSKQKFNSLFYQIPMDDDREEVYKLYKKLLKTDKMILSFEAGGITKTVIVR
jgi:hypothetical protein